MKKTFGILAHVDSGKTTFSEQILYHRGVIRARGRVDNRNTFLDANSIERERGITIFSDQADFFYEGDHYYLIDTPGHVDFSSEMERAIESMDYAILLISGTDGVQGHTDTVWKLLRSYHIPTFVFVNKMDVDTTDAKQIERQLQEKLSPDILSFQEKIKIEEMNTAKEMVTFSLQESLMESIAECEETVLEQYLEVSEQIDWKRVLIDLVKQEKIFPCMFGSALLGEGIEAFFQLFHLFTETDFENRINDIFCATVYKIRYSEKVERLTFLKIKAGQLKVKDEIIGKDADGREVKEKVNQIFFVNGSKCKSVKEACAGDFIAVSGLTIPVSGDKIGASMEKRSYKINPALKARVLWEDTVLVKDIIGTFRILEAEDPMLNVKWESAIGQLHISIMGEIQLEILQSLIKERFGYDISFGKPEVLYLETIQNPVLGYGHFEPLRHYAEVVLRLEPRERGSGITCESQCHVDTLASSYQNLILTHIMEREHKGILTGSSLTDLKIVLVHGISHIKHTEGGDFREATYRAIRQGLEKADHVLLEPMYFFTIYIEKNYLGKVLSDITRLSGTFESPVVGDKTAFIKGKGAVAAFMNYSSELLSFTRGKGQIHFQLAGYDKCHNTEEVIERKGYNKDSDIENVSSSVFCGKGVSFLVKWQEAETYMHTLK